MNVAEYYAVGDDTITGPAYQATNNFIIFCNEQKMTALSLSTNFIFVALLSLLRLVSTAALNQDDGELRFNEHTMIMSHNSAANKDAANGDFFKLFGVDQEDDMYEQLTINGVRGLSLDIRLDPFDRSKLQLVHFPFDYGDFETEMQTHLVRFLEENEEAIVAINFEVVDEGLAAIRPTILANLESTFSNLSVHEVPLKNMTFKYDSEIWANHDEWPTLNEFRSLGQRLFVFHDRTELRSTEYGFIFREDAMKENYWEGLDDCTARYQWDSDRVTFPNSNLSWSRLFFMNHFGSVVGTVGEGLLGGGINGWGSLYPRIKQCMASSGSNKPNFISLDWVVQAEEAIEVAQYLNFGGRIGSGQRCLDDSHCATEACNKILGLCQCKECDPNLDGSSDSCLGCEAEQYCAPVDNNLNECFSSVEAISIAPTGMPVKTPTISPTTNPSSAAPTFMPVEITLSPTTSHPTSSPSALPSATLLRTAMPVEATTSPTTSTPTVPPSFASPTAMPLNATASPTTESSRGSPSAMPLETPSPSTTSNQPPTTETIVTENATLTETQTPMEIQSQANIANNEYENDAFTLFKTPSGMKKVLAIGVLGQALLLLQLF